jgi:hypothetical protein
VIDGLPHHRFVLDNSTGLSVVPIASARASAHPKLSDIANKLDCTLTAASFPNLGQ